jgi:hypothetical protein
MAFHKSLRFIPFAFGERFAVTLPRSHAYPALSVPRDTPFSTRNSLIAASDPDNARFCGKMHGLTGNLVDILVRRVVYLARQGLVRLAFEDKATELVEGETAGNECRGSGVPEMVIQRAGYSCLSSSLK